MLSSRISTSNSVSSIEEASRKSYKKVITPKTPITLKTEIKEIQTIRVPPPNQKALKETKSKYSENYVEPIVTVNYSQLTPIRRDIGFKSGFNYQAFKEKTRPMVNYSLLGV